MSKDFGDITPEHISPGHVDKWVYEGCEDQ